jgi:SPX domain protein involved in polyphosphate accumulation
MTKFSATLQAQMRQEYRDQYVNYKGLKKKIKKTREQAMGSLKDNQSLKQRVEEIRRNQNESQAYEDLMMTPVGEA